MSIRFACPACKTAYTVNDRDAGKKSECKTCGQRLQVPAPQRAKTVLGEALPIDRQQTVAASESATQQPKGDEPAPDDAPAPGTSFGYVPPIPKSPRLPKPVV